jgi:hypothetical protein
VSVIYKALSTIEAAEGVRHAYPGGAEVAAARRRSGRRRFRVLPIVALASAACALAVVATGPRSIVPEIAALIGVGGPTTSGRVAQAPATVAVPVPTHKARQESTADAVPSSEGIVAGPLGSRDVAPGEPAREERANSRTDTTQEVTADDEASAAVSSVEVSSATSDSGSATSVAAGTKPAHVHAAHQVSAASGSAPAETEPKLAATGSVDYVFQPARSREGTAPAVAPVSTANATAFRYDGVGDKGDEVRRPKAQEGASGGQKVSLVTTGASDTGQGDYDRDMVSVTANHTQRIRLLNSELSQAIDGHDKGRVEDILQQLERLVGGDSTYMLKVRAFTQLALGGDSEHAMNLLREVLARDPDDRDASFNMAIAEINLGKVDQARDRLETLAASHPGDTQVGQLLRSVE